MGLWTVCCHFPSTFTGPDFSTLFPIYTYNTNQQDVLFTFKLFQYLTSTCFEQAAHHQEVSKVRVKCTLVQALRLCTGRTAHRGSRVIALPFHDHGTGRGWGGSVTLGLLFTPGKDPVPIVQEAGWAPGPVWTGAENFAPHRESIPGPFSS